jgi:transcriptional regulator with XRE-family HTH domain
MKIKFFTVKENPMEDKEIGAKIRQLRKQRAITLDVLTMRTGLSPGYLSKIERGLSSPPIATLSRIAFALGVKLSDFFQDYEETLSISIITPSERKALTRDGQTFGYRYETLAHRRQNKLMEPFIISLIPHRHDNKMFVHKGEEMLYLLEGEIEMIYGDDRYQVTAVGTCIYIDASVPHRALCIGDNEARVLVVVSQPQENESNQEIPTRNEFGTEQAG